ncbi:Uncharacterised protein [Chlamydia trachomatis]|nr:Uncharacterised protein [Chlamydia trachomatis]
MLGDLLLEGCYALLKVCTIVDLQEATIRIEIVINELTHLVKELEDTHPLTADGRHHGGA